MDLPKNYFIKERTVLKAFGLSFSGNEGTTYKIYSFLFLFTLNYCYPVLEFGDIFKHDFEVVVDILIYEFTVFVGMAKTTTALQSRIKLGKILDKLEQPPFAPNAERGGNIETKLIKKCLWITSTQTILYWTFAAVSVAFGVTYTLVRRIRSSNYEDWQFTFGPLTILNVTYSPNYEISWFYQNVAITSIGCHFSTIDLVTAAVLAHLSTQFKILQNNIRRILYNARNEMLKDGIKDNVDLHKPIIDGSEIPYKYLKKSLEDVVRYHLAIISVVNEVEGLFSGVLLLAFVGTLGMLCLSVYHASLIPYNDIQLLRSLTEIMSMCMQVLTLCFWGEQVMFESERVGRAAYESNFVGADLRYQKGMALIVRRSQYPTRVTAGRFADICLTTCTWILRTSYSAFMVLRKNNLSN